MGRVKPSPPPKKRGWWFSRVFFLFVFLYYKNINMVLKYLVFYEMLQYMEKQKKNFVFMHTVNTLKIF
jgi:hypothetical protein